MNYFLIVLSSITLQVQSFESVCKKLQVSTNIQVSKDDVISNGVVMDKWNQNTPNPVIATSSVMIDYLYVTLEGSHKPLDVSSFSLEYNDHFFANSSVSIVKQQVSKHGGLYSLEMKYKCKQYGGALISYELLFHVPECGNAHIYWKKICGNPLLARDGLTVDVQYKKYNQTIVKNGKLIDTSYFDNDLDNYVFQIPSSQTLTRFFIYMDLPQQTTEEQTQSFKKAIQNDDDKINEDPEESAEFQILEAVLKMIPEVKVQIPIIDADTSILRPQIKGQLANGGLVTSIPQSIELTYNCIEQGDTTIELIVPVDYFKDLNFIFVKKCFEGGYKHSQGSSLLAWFLTIFFFFEVVGTVYNIIKYKKNGIQAIPFSGLLQALCSKIIPYISFLHFGGSSKDNNSNNSSNTRSKRFPYKSMAEGEDYENEFKIENLKQQESYGSL